ncbi:MAG: 30S ribosome-binding factor RbfA [Victivallaceae bacterium]|nr:30S ribosome-binding factor RbfA [Victivallaceae bacterium]
MPRCTDRMARVNELLKRVIADALSKDSFFPCGMLVSVTEVRCTTDLATATVAVSLFGGKASDKEKAMRELEARKPELQHCIAGELGLKRTPVLTFIPDDRIEAGDRVLAIIEEETRGKDEK